MSESSSDRPCEGMPWRTEQEMHEKYAYFVESDDPDYHEIPEKAQQVPISQIYENMGNPFLGLTEYLISFANENWPEALAEVVEWEPVVAEWESDSRIILTDSQAFFVDQDLIAYFLNKDYAARR